MIYLAAAVYAEAKPIIQRAGLKKDMEQTRFQLFRGNGLTVLLTGVGCVRAAVAVTWLFSLYPPGPGDYLVNMGTCGSASSDMSPGSLFLCHKITDAATGRTWYPDLLFPHPFGEAPLVTVPRILEKPGSVVSGCLADMEASGIFEAASFCVSPHQLIFFKVVSDVIGDGKPSLTPDALTELTLPHTAAVLDWLNRLPLRRDSPLLTREESLLLESVCGALRLTATMKADLCKKVLYNKYTVGTASSILDGFLHAQDGSVLTKPERKKRFEQLRQLLS